MARKKTFFNFFLSNIHIFLMVIFFAFLFFYRLNYNTLASWDEAWYGTIARNILKTGDWLKLYWNGNPYYDHPPFGFWLMAITYRLFGISELTTRLPSVLLGLGTVFLLYLFCKDLFGKKSVGIAASFILGTCVWYLIRVRSGNLDSIFVFFYVSTLYLSLKSQKNIKYLPLVALSFGALMLTKTLVGLSAAILILFLNFKNLKKDNWKTILLSLLLFLLLVTPWYFVQFINYPDFFNRHFQTIGTRNLSFSALFKLQPQLPLFYLHMGVRKWYYLWIFGLGLIMISFRFIRKNVFFILLWNLLILYPFLTSDKTELWHLIPVYIPLAVITAYGIDSFFEISLWFLKKISSRVKFLKIFFNEKVFTFFYLAIFIIFAFIQIKGFWIEVYPKNKYIGDDVDISLKLKKYTGQIFFDDDFLPVACFYSGKDLSQIRYLPEDRNTLIKLWSQEKKGAIALTRNWVLSNLEQQGMKYLILEQNNSYVIIKKI